MLRSLLQRRNRETRQLARTVEKQSRALKKMEKERRRAKPDVVPLDYPHAELVLTVPTKSAGVRRNATAKEPFTVDWIESLPAGEQLYDIGANVGAYSLIAASRPRGPLPVIAFEPAFATFAVLCSNIIANNVAEHVVPMQVTLGARTGLGHFAYRSLNPAAAQHPGIGESDDATIYSQTVLVYALGELVERFGLTPPAHMKLDVDGAEMEVLRGASTVLCHTQSLLVELEGSNADEATRYLMGHGLQPEEEFRRGGSEGADPGPESYYVLYRRQSH